MKVWIDRGQGVKNCAATAHQGGFIFTYRHTWRLLARGWGASSTHQDGWTTTTAGKVLGSTSGGQTKLDEDRPQVVHSLCQDRVPLPW